jgi:exodeoxyribonuclease V gamma subunit
MKTPGLYTSNKVENLVQVLAEVLSRPLSSPLQPDVIVVQSKGMERYLSMQLAGRLGIWANCRYLFPNTLLAELFKKALRDPPPDSPFEPDILTWRIMKALPAVLGRPGFESLKDYLKGDTEDLRRLQLSAALADAYDQYLLFRPDMILRWEEGEEDHWQAQLWRRLSAGLEERHRAALARRFLDVLPRLSPEERSLPERISVFGISALPRFHMDMLAAVSRFTEVNLFLMNPCREYWGDLQSGDGGLLPSLGRLGRDFMDMVIELGWQESPLFESPVEDRLLRILQADILHLRGVGGTEEKMPLAKEDRSLQIHCCHSPMREVEVLRDQILHRMDNDPGLKPCDILVMTPDIRVHAPYIQAVFDIPSSDPTWIPFSIADQGLFAESSILEPFDAILDLPGSRFGATQVLALLECPSVCRRFGIEEREVEVIRRWVGDTRIRWGRDGHDREEAGLPGFEENTWRAGLDRLFLGYAMPGRGERLFGSILPYDSIEGSEAGSLGRLASFVEALARSADELEGKRTLGEWSRILTGVVERFFDAEGESEREVQHLRGGLARLARMESDEEAGCDVPVDLRCLRWHLGRTLEREGFGYGFLTGGITFCAMLPMRSIPSKLICLIGMDNSAYPRESHAPGFDLIGKHPRPGDRSRRNDDRYLFLEAILAARDILYISYVGKDIQDNSAKPPSVLVSELLDDCERRFAPSSGTVTDHLVTVHGLQPFSPRYFTGEERLYSYSEEDCEAALHLRGERHAPVLFVGTGLSRPDETFRRLDLADLCSFFIHPARYLLQKRLGLYLGEEPPVPEDKEPMGVEGLERYRLEQDMVRRGLGGLRPRDLFPVYKASGLIPPGRVGECLFQETAAGVETFLEAAGPFLRREVLKPLEVDLRIGGFGLVGRIDGLYPGEMVRYRYAGIKAADCLHAWVRHLILNAISPEGYPRTTRIMGIGEKRNGGCIQHCFSPVEESGSLIEGLLDLYWSGLINPLHFFPASSKAYAERLSLCGEEGGEAVRLAKRTWQGGEWERGEREDPYYQICFAAEDPLDSAFEEASMRVFGPLLKRLG